MKLKVGVAAGGIILSLLFAGISQSALPKLDRSFGAGGLALTGFGGQPDRETSTGGGLVSVQAESTAGSLSIFARSSYRFESSALFRLDSSGSLEPGSVRRWFTKGYSERVIVASPDGGYLALQRTKISRFRSDGRLMRSFGKSGTVTLKGTVERAKFSKQGRIYVVAQFRKGASVVTFSSDGSQLNSLWFPGWTEGAVVDISPSGQALLVLDEWREVEFEGPIVLERRSFVVLDPEGGTKFGPTIALDDLQNYVRFRAGGGFLIAGGGEPLTALRPDGSIDTDFGVDGVARCESAETAPSYSYVTAMARDSRNRIVVFEATGEPNCGFTRYLPDGSIDKNFNPSAALPRSSSEVEHLWIDSNDRLIVSNWERETGGPAIRRFTEDGNVDPSFGDGGTTRVPIRVPNDDEATDSALQRDGRLVVAGTTRSQDGLDKDFAILRYRRNGSLDLSFGSRGKVTFDSGGADSVAAIAMQLGGRIVVAGTISGKAGIARFLPDGRIDRSFGDAGTAAVSGPGFDSEISRYEDLVLRPDGKITAIGTVSDGPDHTDWLIGQVRRNGAADSGFLGGGASRIDVGKSKGSIYGDDPGDYDEGLGIDSDRRNRLVLVGVSARPAQNRDIVIYRLRPDGRRLVAFGKKGRTRISPQIVVNPSDPFKVELNVMPREIALLGRGALAIVAGRQGGGSGTGLEPRNHGALIKVNSAGRLDRKFGDGAGFVRSRKLDMRGLTIDRCGRITVAGSLSAGKGDRDNDPRDDLGVARYLRDGQVDRRFAGGTLRLRAGVGHFASGNTLAAGAGGRYYISGSALARDSSRNFVTASILGKKSRCR